MIGANDITDQALQQRDVRSWQGELVFDDQGEVIGRVADVLVGKDRKPEWLIVSFGAFLHEDRLIPVFDIKATDHGFTVSYSKEMVREAPVVSVQSTSDEDENKLRAYWCTTREAAMPRACTLLSAAK